MENRNLLASEEFLLKEVESVVAEKTSKYIHIVPMLVMADSKTLEHAENASILLMRRYGSRWYMLPSYDIDLHDKKNFKLNLFGIMETGTSLLFRYFGVKIKKFSKKIYNNNLKDIWLIAINDDIGKDKPKHSRFVAEHKWFNLLDFHKNKDYNVIDGEALEIMETLRKIIKK